MSVRDYAILWVGATKGVGGGLSAGGGNVLLKTPPHKLDGPEHLAADDTTRLDASIDRHGLLPKLSGDAGDVLRGDGTYGPGGPTNAMVPTFIASSETFTVPADRQALFAMPIDNEGVLDVEGFLVEVD